MTIDWNLALEAFKLAPAIIALFAVIFLMYRIIVRKDDTISKLVSTSQADMVRESKMLTLLEILVNRSGIEKGGK